MTDPEETIAELREEIAQTRSVLAKMTEEHIAQRALLRDTERAVVLMTHAMHKAVDAFIIIRREIVGMGLPLDVHAFVDPVIDYLAKIAPEIDREAGLIPHPTKQ